MAPWTGPASLRRAERSRLAGIVAGLAPPAIDEDDLVANAIEHFVMGCRNRSPRLAS